MQQKINPLVQIWVGQGLPDEHVYIRPENRPQGLKNITRVYFRKWLIHPLKRKIAKYYLVILREFFGLKVVGITGSCGKTTTKDLIASILKLSGPTVYSFANIDPVYNIPTTILKCRPWTKYLVLEMGVEYPGEMDYYLWLVTPDIGVITNINPTHTLYFGDVNGVLAEKSKLVKALPKTGFAVLNKNDIRLKSLSNKLQAKIVWFDGTKEKDQVHSNYLQNQDNVACAKTVVQIWELSDKLISQGLVEFTPQDHRLRIIHHLSGAILVDDSYNNNPKAAEFAIRAFEQLAGKHPKIIVFGDMLELGSLEKAEHQKIGLLLKELHFDKLILVGRAVKEIKIGGVQHFATWQKAKPVFEKLLVNGNYILIKGSRSIGLDNLFHGMVY